jgi:hypothetical protein
VKSLLWILILLKWIQILSLNRLILFHILIILKVLVSELIMKRKRLLLPVLSQLIRIKLLLLIKRNKLKLKNLSNWYKIVKNLIRTLWLMFLITSFNIFRLNLLKKILPKFSICWVRLILLKQLKTLILSRIIQFYKLSWLIFKIKINFLTK